MYACVYIYIYRERERKRERERERDVLHVHPGGKPACPIGGGRDPQQVLWGVVIIVIH